MFLFWWFSARKALLFAWNYAIIYIVRDFGVYKNMTKREIKKLNKFVVNNPQKETIHISVYLVYRGNFNDERLVESKEFSVAELADQPLVWIDAYLGKHKQSAVKIAFAYLEKNRLYFLEDDSQKIKVVEKTGFSYYYSDDYDDAYIIAAHIW